MSPAAAPFVDEVRVPSWPEGLVRVDPAALSEAGRVDLLVALERLRSWADAQQQRLLVAMAGPGERDGKDWVREEIACALRLAPVSVNARLHVARELAGRPPSTLDLLERGTITMRHANLLVDAVSALDDGLASAVETRVLPRAGEQTVAEFRRSVRRAVLALDPAGAEERHERALPHRRVCARAVEDGMAEIWALLPADGAATLMAGVDALAAQWAGDGRTADQRRADALVALGDSSLADAPQSQGRRPSIQVTVALSTLLGLDDQPAELEGYGPITGALARRIAADESGTWRRLVTDPQGRLLDYGRSTYRPPRDLADFVIARDQTSRFPGNARAACRCELDHQKPFSEGGTTSPDNLVCLSRRSHHLKHEAGWAVRGDPADYLTWTSPTGHEYRSPPGTFPIDRTASLAELADDDQEPDPPPF